MKKGFTLVELIVVLAIIAIIAAIAVPTAFGAIDKAQIAADEATVDTINSVIRMGYTLEKLDKEFDGTVTSALLTKWITDADVTGLDAKPQYKSSTITYVEETATTPPSFAYASTGGDDSKTWEALAVMPTP